MQVVSTKEVSRQGNKEGTFHFLIIVCFCIVATPIPLTWTAFSSRVLMKTTCIMFRIMDGGYDLFKTQVGGFV